MNRNKRTLQKPIRVKNLQEFQQVSQRLHEEGFVCMPGRFTADGGQVVDYHDIISSQLCTVEKTDKKDRIPLLFVSSGSEMAVSDKIGTPGHGFITWGNGNRIPNTIALLTGMLPYTAAGWKFNTDLLAGLGPAPMYHYTQYVGGNMTEKEIPYQDAGVLINGLITDLKIQRQRLLEPQEQEDGSFIQPSTIGDDVVAAIDEQIKQYQADLETWKAQCDEIINFRDCSRQAFLPLASDAIMFNICFPELDLNQQQLDDNKTVVKDINRWTPKVQNIICRPAHTCRLERMDDEGKIRYVYVSNRWYDTPLFKIGNDLDEIAAIPAVSKETPAEDIGDAVLAAKRANVSTEQRPTRFMMICSYPTPGRPYYPVAAWHSIFGGDIYEYAATIISDRAKRKKNSNVIGRIIYINTDYLAKLYTQQSGPQPGSKKGGKKPTEKTPDQIRDEMFKSINDYLKNRDNAGKSLMGFTFTSPVDGKQQKSFEIVEIESADKSSADANQTELQEISSIIFFAMGLDSQLVGNTPGTSTRSGGTDLRERYLLKQIQMSPMQEIILQPWRAATKFNKWDKHLVWRVKREVLTTLDNSKTGITNAKTDEEE